MARVPHSTWVAQNAVDPGYQAIARAAPVGRTAASRSPTTTRSSSSPRSVPKEFDALIADRKGDIYLAQGKRDEAKAEYQKAWTAFDPANEYRRLVEIKLNAVGVDPKTLSSAAAAPAKNP
jgi:tetratricopeptide (TPR) repeat protein